MNDVDSERAALRCALADAERARDAALAEAADVKRRWAGERREEQHRLRNLFSVVRAVARQTGDDVETVEEYCGVLDGRLSAYLDAQAMVMRDWAKGADLAMLLAGALQKFDLKEGERVDLVGPPVRLTSEAAGILALAFYELAQAAVMSDGIGEPAGNLRVTWQLSGKGPDRTLLIDWTGAAQEADPGGEEPSSWADWVEQALRYQLAGTLTTHVRRVTRVCLPSSTMC